MLLKYCRCGAIIPADRQRCARCEQLHQSRHTAYNAQCRSQKAAAFYVSREWRTIRPVIISIYDGIDIWAFYECDKLLAADEVHHVEELDTAWDRRLDPFNLFSLAHASHTAITGRSPQGEHGMFLFLTVQGGFVHADIRFNLKNCYSKKLSHKII